MSVLVIGPEEKEDIKQLITYAENNVIKLDRLKAMVAKQAPPVGDLPGYRMILPNGYRVVYSVEEQPSGLFRHISISLKNGSPPPPAIDMIIAEFGFKTKLENGRVRSGPVSQLWLEGTALNLLEKIEAEPAKATG
jgi:hypothetical protein